MSACSSQPSQKDMGEIYGLALEAYMPIDEGLNTNMEYIAIDMSNFKELDDTDKEQIFAYFDKYKVEVMEASYEQLKGKGLYNAETQVLNDVLLRVEETKISNNKVDIEGHKYRAGDGAVGVRIVLKHKGDKWKVTEAKGTWKS